MTRLKLQDWQGAESDARKAIELYGPKNYAAMKAHYYLAQALLALRHVGEALDEAKYAYSICLETKDSSLALISQLILKAKQAQWQSRETARLHELNSTLALVEDLLQQQLERDLAEVESRFEKQEIGETGRNEERTDLEKEAEERRKIVRAAFTDSKNAETAERVSVSPLTWH